MHKTIKAALASTVLFTAFAAAPAFAEDESPIKITGSAALTTDYRLRGISQTDGQIAGQLGLTASHESGLYVGLWASNLAGAGTFGGANLEVDTIIGYTKPVGPVTLDGGLIWYNYPGTDSTDFGEIYGSVSGKVGPLNAKLGAYWAFDQKAIKFGPTRSKGHNVWVYSDWALPIESTPLTLKAHLGYSSGKSTYTRGKAVLDYAFGADLAYKNLTLNLSYIGTDISTAHSTQWDCCRLSGHDITKGNVVATLTAAF